MPKDPRRTEKATPRRRQKAREEGHVLKSQDVPISLSLVAVSLLLFFYIPYAYKNLVGIFNYTMTQAFSLNVSLIVWTLGYVFLLLILPAFLVLLAVGIFGNVVQFGFIFSLKPLAPKLDTINPVKGIQRLVSLKTIFETFRNSLKLAIALIVGYFSAKHFLSGFYSFSELGIFQQALIMVKLTVIMFLIFGLLSIPVAFIDFMYRRWEYEESLKMTKEEVKEEMKQYEGHPLIRSAIRKKQREIARKRMLARVKEADVVITNPTHYAVALKYERGKMEAPQVVAKGVDTLAEKIKEIAYEYDIPVEENPELARAIYETCEVGDYIPSKFYTAVAKILAKVYRRRKMV